jgi:hypothetical protein
MSGNPFWTQKPSRPPLTKAQMNEMMINIMRYSKSPIGKLRDEASMAALMWGGLFQSKEAGKYAHDLILKEGMMRILAPSFSKPNGAQHPTKSAKPEYLNCPST